MPQIINDISLERISDDVLEQLFLSTRSKIRKCRRQKNRSLARILEHDMCYIQKELQIRRMARYDTVRYLKMNDRFILGKIK